MSEERKISIVFLGTEDHLKKNLISIILGRDVFSQRSTDVKIEVYENDIYEATCTPNVYESSEEIRNVFSSQHPDICLLVVKEGFSTQEVKEQIEKLDEITGKQFIVVLPFGNKHEESYPFKFCTMEDLFSKLRKLAEDRNLMPANKRSAEQPTQMEMDEPPSVAACPPHTCEDKIELADKQPEEDVFLTREVQQQIEKLHNITGKPTEEFIVVLPLRRKHAESYPSNYYTIEDLFNKLRELAEDRNLTSSNKRSAEQPHTQPSFFVKLWRGLTGSSTNDKKRLKGDHPGTKVNLVLLGMSGTGKSETGNTILGKRLFESKPSSMPITTECQVAETEIIGRRVRVIDTPDMFDDEIETSVKKQHVTQCRQLCQSDPCVYLLVMHVSRFTDGERDILKKFEEAFGPEAKEQTIILFTRGEELQRADMSFESFLQDCQPELSKIVEQCGGRCVLFENEMPGQHQVPVLMQTVNMMLDKQQKQ